MMAWFFARFSFVSGGLGGSEYAPPGRPAMAADPSAPPVPDSAAVATGTGTPLLLRRGVGWCFAAAIAHATQQ